jgi:H+/gluconate symporter-like permease
MSMTSILIVAVFAIIVLLMVFDKIQAVVALPLMAIALSIVASIPVNTITNDIIGKGVSVLASSIYPTLIAAILGEIIKRTGIAETIIRSAAELGGDNPYLVAILCFFAVGFSFIGLVGGGARIMMGLIVFPIMLSVGVPKLTAGAVMLYSSFIGYLLNVARWKFIQSLVETDMSVVKEYAFMLLVPGIVIGIIMIIVGIKIKGPMFSWAANANSSVNTAKRVPIYSLITPIIPLILVLAFKWDINASFIVAMVYAIVTTQWKNKFKGVYDMLNRSIYDGFSNVAVTIALMFGIGMVVTAARHENLITPIGEVLKAIIPSTPLMIVFVFGLLGPILTLFRGPLNPWGLGAALAGILATSSLPAGVLVAMFWIYDIFVGVTDPTASQVAWTAGYLETTPTKLVRSILPFSWILSLVGMIIAVIMY